MLQVKDLTVRFATPDGLVTAVDRLSVAVAAGETLAVVGESGSGKSVTALALTRLLAEPPAFYAGGEIRLDQTSILDLSPRNLRRVRGKEIAYIFQEPATSLNPVFSIYAQMAETLRRHRPEVRDLRSEVSFWLDQVGIAEPERRMRDYPFQLSGGMLQRVMIAMALCCRPKLLVADEPTTALDVTVQRQILQLFAELQQKFNMAILLITHNFGILQGLAHRVAVMWRGQLVEEGSINQVMSSPRHPYTRALIDCVPRLGAHLSRLRTIDPAVSDSSWSRR